MRYFGQFCCTKLGWPNTKKLVTSDFISVVTSSQLACKDLETTKRTLERDEKMKRRKTDKKKVMG